MIFDFDAYVTAAAFIGQDYAFALGDGVVRFETGQAKVHSGAILAAAVHPAGKGLVTGGDDGRLVWSQPDHVHEIIRMQGKWTDAVAASPASGLIACASGKEVHVFDAADPAFHTVFAHEKSVAGLAFDPKGRRLACATYGGASLWFARIAVQKPLFLKWAGSHIALAFSPDGKFLISSMQENQLHGWRLADSKDLRMGGYPAKVKSIVFLAKGALMATAGAQGAVVWPFAGSSGPMGKEAAEVAYDESTMVVRVAAALNGSALAGGLEDGRVWVIDLSGGVTHFVKAEKGPPITALAMSADGRQIAWGDEDGGAGLVPAPALG